MKTSINRRELLCLSMASSFHLARAPSLHAQQQSQDVHRQLLELAAYQQQQRRDHFAAVTTPAQLQALQKSLRDDFLRLIGGLPTSNEPPPVSRTRGVEAEDYSIEKLVFESFPGYFVPALLYRPKIASGPKPAVISPCGHSAVGKAADAYQILHINLARRGFIVLTYDPVGQGERSQFWDAVKKSSKFNLVCGEHAVLGNPLYLLGTSLARYRIWDGMRAIDYLTSLPEVDAKRIGCVGNSGGGTLTAYISAFDSRVAAAAICCYITALPRRMANRIEKDPDADPEQDIFGFVSAGIDHAGLLALRAPKPTLIGAAQDDFFPIAGTRESFAEAQKLFTVAGAADHIALVEAPGRHGLSLPLRTAVYRWFDRWLAGGNGDETITELPVEPRPARDLLVTESGQVNLSLNSRHLLPLALDQFRDRPPPSKRPLRDVLLLDPESAEYRLTEITPRKPGNSTLVVCVNGNESPPWSEQKDLLEPLTSRGFATVMIDPRGVGSLRPPGLQVGRRNFADPLAGVEENLAYNAFLLGKSLLGMRISDVLAAIRDLLNKSPSTRIVLCGRRDAALVCCFTAALEPKISAVAAEEMPLTYLRFFDPAGTPINAASIAPSLLHSFGDIPDVLSQISPRNLLLAAGLGEPPPRLPATIHHNDPFTKQPQLLLDWLSQL